MKKYFLVMLSLCLLLVGCNKKNDPNTTKETVDASLLVLEEKINFDYNYYKEKNSDFVGFIEFEGGLLAQPVFQGETNNTYLRTNWETGDYDVAGSVFMDSDSTLSDQNVIVYGHYVYKSMDPEGTIMFTPLAKLQDKEVYQENQYLRFYLENGVRLYKMVATFFVEVGEYDTVNPNLRYFLPEYDEKYFKKYKSEIRDIELFGSDVDINYDDKLLTLQTCTEEDTNMRQIVLFKFVSYRAYSN